MFEGATHHKVDGERIDIGVIIERINQTEGWEPAINEDGEITAVKSDDV